MNKFRRFFSNYFGKAIILPKIIILVINPKHRKALGAPPPDPLASDG